MIVKKNYYKILCALVVIPTTLCGIFPIGVFRPWDINLRPPYVPGKRFQVTAFGEFGYKSRAVNPDGNEVNVTQIWNQTQDAIAMLQGFPEDSPITQYLNDVVMDPTDDGVRGNFRTTGKFDFNAGSGLIGRYHFCDGITLMAYLPFYSMRLKDVEFEDLTRTFNEEDIRVKETLTGPICEVLAAFSDGLTIKNGWKRSGIGDAGVIAYWFRDFRQPKRFLKNVYLTTRFGVTAPTGKRIDADEILSVPFGFDGSWGILFGAGIQLTWLDHIRGGVDFEFIHLFGNTRERRIKVAPNQTDFLYLAKVKAYKDFGFTQQYNLFLEGLHFWGGLTGTMIYQFWRHNDDRLALCTNEFSNNVANTAENLQQWTIHQAIFKLSYDFGYQCVEDKAVVPHVTAFYKLPFNGERAILINTAGLIFTLSF